MNYSECIADIDIAKTELMKMKLFPNNIIADLYCIPAHNHQAYYAVISKVCNDYEITYVKPLTYSVNLNGPVKMYSFGWCKQAEKHPGKQGQFVMGIKEVNKDFIDAFLQTTAALPNKVITEKRSIIDSVTQVIRTYGNNPKEIFYHDTSVINDLTAKQRDFLDSLYIEIEKIIQ